MWRILACAHGGAFSFYCGWIFIDILRSRVISGNDKDREAGLEKETQFVAHIVPFCVLFTARLINQWNWIEEAVGLACT